MCAIITRTYRNSPNTRMLACTLASLYLNRMGWVKASALGVGDCNFTHDVTRVPLPPRFLPSLYHVASLLRCILPSYVQHTYIYSPQSVENPLFPLFILLTWLLRFSFLAPSASQQTARLLLSLRISFLREISIIPVINDWLGFSVEFGDIDRPGGYN